MHFADIPAPWRRLCIVIIFIYITYMMYLLLEAYDYVRSEHHVNTQQQQQQHHHHQEQQHHDIHSTLNYDKQQPQDFSQWYTRIASGKDLRKEDFDLLESILIKFENTVAVELGNPKHWVSGTLLNVTKYFRPGRHSGVTLDRFAPYVERKVLPPGSKVAIWGDIHGSAFSLLRTLDHLYHQLNCMIGDGWILREDCYIVVLGDFVDRGPNGLESLYTLARLKVASPQQVMILRGNHEDININFFYGLMEEITSKFRFNRDIKDRRAMQIFRWFQYLPAALYIGGVPESSWSPASTISRQQWEADAMAGNYGLVEYVSFSHGSWEFGYEPRTFLADTSSDVRYEYVYILKRVSVLKKLVKTSTPDISAAVLNLIHQSPSLSLELQEDFILESPTRPRSFGLMWHDVLPFLRSDSSGATTPLLTVVEGRGIAYGQDIFMWMLDNASTLNRTRVTGVIRAHQHNNLAGNMLAALIETRGVVDMFRTGMWQRKNRRKRTFVLTCLSAPQANLMFLHDSYSVITVPGYGETYYKEWFLVHYFREFSKESFMPFLEEVFSLSEDY